MAQPFTKTADDPYSYFQPMGYMNSTSCGYCRKSTNDNGKPPKRFMFYATTKSLKPSFYQALIDRSWRRSGSLIYRPNQREACCPHYTIRLDASAYRPTKDHRQTVNRFTHHVVGGEYTKVAQRVKPLSRADAHRRANTFDLCERLHEVEAKNLEALSVANTRRRRSKLPKGTSENVQPAHRFEVTLEPDTYTDEKYEIYANYQRTIHNEPDHKITKATFTGFLCNSPLRRETEIERDAATGGIREKKLGSYHQCYWLDGKLVAVSVLDLLPHCVSAVYFMYDQAVHKFNPGKLSAMREIALALEGGYKWWYSGFYIASCPKMRYKLGFMPQYVLDPEVYEWDPFDKDAQALYCRKPYVSLSRERRLEGKTDEKQKTVEDTPEAEDEYTILPLFESSMPGMYNVCDKIDEMELGKVPILSTAEPEPFPAYYLASWRDSTYTDNKSIKSRLAELVAMMGGEAIPEICLDFCKQ